MADPEVTRWSVSCRCDKHGDHAACDSRCADELGCRHPVGELITAGTEAEADYLSGFTNEASPEHLAAVGAATQVQFTVGADFAVRVTDAAHAHPNAAELGHVNGFCRACSAIYVAVMAALPDADSGSEVQDSRLGPGAPVNRSELHEMDRQRSAYVTEIEEPDSGRRGER